LLVKKLLIIWIIIFPFYVITKEAEEIAQIREGNFALPGSQQPGTLFGFGQNIVGKHDVFVFVYENSFFGPHKSTTEVIPSLLYGIRDDLSLFLSIPVAPRFRFGPVSFSGIEDMIIQLEYAPLIRETPTKTNQISLAASLYLPTGDERKFTGFGSPSFFLGFIANHLSLKWYWYTSIGVLLPTKHGNSKFGNRFFYQTGIGRNISYSPHKWILAWTFELNGLYRQKRTTNGMINPDSGGNTIYIGPTLWFSTQRFIAQGGIAPILSQHLFGSQFKDKLFIAFNFAWKFH